MLKAKGFRIDCTEFGVIAAAALSDVVKESGKVGDLWLFQVLPFSQNQRARQSAYLYELDRILVPADDIELEDEFPPRPVAAVPADSTGADDAP